MLLANYFQTGWRNLLKNKLFSLINIVGLAIGLAACALILMFVKHETSYDNFWQNADKIHRSHVTFSIPGRDPMHATSAPGPLIHALKKDFPEVEYATRIGGWGPTINHNGQVFVEQIKLVDADFAKMFSVDVLAGDLELALSDNSSIVLNESLAKKYFGDSNPLGQVLSLDFNFFKKDFQVGAVIADTPRNSQLDLPALILIDESAWEEQNWMFHGWFSVNAQLYFQTQQASDLDSINRQFDDFANRNFPKMPIGGDDAKASDFIKLSAMNIQDLHLNAIGFGEMRPQGSKTTVITFSAIAMLILLIACINFMNLSTAHAANRAKEVSLRKVLGATRSNLITQFLGESVLMTLISVLLAFVMVELALPFYNETLNQELVVSYDPSTIATLLGLAISVGVLSGLYPAFILSGFRPATVLKANKSAETGASLRLRAALVIFQFAVSIGLFIATSVVYSQMQYAKQMDAGFNKDNMLVVNRVSREEASNKRELLLKEIAKNPQVTAITYSNETPGNTNENNTMMRTPEMAEEDALLMGQRAVGYGFFKAYEINLIAGRTYDKNRADVSPTDEQLRAGEKFPGSIVINESALRRFGFKDAQSALGKTLITGRGDPEENLSVDLTIIGVVDDVHFNSLHATIRPEVYPLSADFGNSISVRFTGSPEQLVKDVETLWRQEIPGVPFSYSFVEDNIAELYQSEQGEATMFAAFSALAILVASLGLFGLASFTADRRTKEIGVRKVMGAGVFDIVKMLMWQFSKPVMVASLIAWPVAFYFMSDWLEAFVYRIDTSLIIAMCGLAALFALCIAWVTVASNSIRVARANPIKALRYE
ncbi:ABC transporter permease [Thalassotalea mangrovi]|uniref:FtsX-like permease family protein n=1 Tax=Thalassotalea mangrovi TaxID=2572245 RepID=A0A4U1B2Y9_9GAMM|nr:ABC transporter permease [Thalassotalea mangrovi]TKB43369.1 FtsX-like permease family protein [Thalassotalea mangrovi]